MRKVSRDSPTQPPYNLGFKHTTMAKLDFNQSDVAGSQPTGVDCEIISLLSSNEIKDFTLYTYKVNLIGELQFADGKAVALSVVSSLSEYKKGTTVPLCVRVDKNGKKAFTI